MAEHDGIIAILLFFIVLFSVLLVINSKASITGMAVVDTKENVQQKVKDFVNKSDFLKSVEETNICLIIRMDATTTYSYKITKIEDVIDVTFSDNLYCSGTDNEDFIFSYVSYEKFLEHANSNPTFEELKATAGGQNFYVLPSKYVESGMTVKNKDEFLAKYNSIFQKFSPSEQRQFLTLPEKRAARSLFPMWIVYFGFGLVVLVLLLVLLLPKFTPKPAVEETLQLVTYIRSAIAKGYTEENIRESLIGSGWSKEEVEKAMQMAVQQETHGEQEVKEQAL